MWHASKELPVHSASPYCEDFTGSLRNFSTIFRILPIDDADHSGEGGNISWQGWGFNI
jgi:hypothetical protein